MAKRIITISREFGSGGRFIGEKVAKKLGIAYYDKNIINDIAEKSGLSPEYVQKNAESFFLRWSLKRTSDSFYCSDVNTAYGCFYFFFDWNKIIDACITHQSHDLWSDFCLDYRYL